MRKLQLSAPRVILRNARMGLAALLLITAATTGCARAGRAVEHDAAPPREVPRQEQGNPEVGNPGGGAAGGDAAAAVLQDLNRAAAIYRIDDETMRKIVCTTVDLVERGADVYNKLYVQDLQATYRISEDQAQQIANDNNTEGNLLNLGAKLFNQGLCR